MWKQCRIREGVRLRDDRCIVINRNVSRYCKRHTDAKNEIFPERYWGGGFWLHLEIKSISEIEMEDFDKEI